MPAARQGTSTNCFDRESLPGPGPVTVKVTVAGLGSVIRYVWVGGFWPVSVVPSPQSHVHESAFADESVHDSWRPALAVQSNPATGGGGVGTGVGVGGGVGFGVGLGVGFGVGFAEAFAVGVGEGEGDGDGDGEGPSVITGIGVGVASIPRLGSMICTNVSPGPSVTGGPKEPIAIALGSGDADPIGTTPAVGA